MIKSTALLGFVWGGSQYPWNSKEIIGLFAASVVSFFIFGRIEKKAREPILPLSLFKNSIFSISMLIVFLAGVAMFGVILYIPLFAQIVLGISATNSGTILTPLMLGLIFSSVITGQIFSRTGKYKLLVILGLGIIPIALFLLSGMNPQTTQGGLILRSVFVGVGLGIIMPTFTVVVQNAFDHSKLGVVTASTQLFRQIGGTVGVAIMGSILNNSLSQKLGEISESSFVQTLLRVNPNFGFETVDINKLQGLLGSQAAIEMGIANLPALIKVNVMQAFVEFSAKVKQIFALSIGEVFLASSLVMIVALIASFFLKEIPLRKSHH